MREFWLLVSFIIAAARRVRVPDRPGRLQLEVLCSCTGLQSRCSLPASPAQPDSLAVLGRAALPPPHVQHQVQSHSKITRRRRRSRRSRRRRSYLVCVLFQLLPCKHHIIYGGVRLELPDIVHSSIKPVGSQ